MHWPDVQKSTAWCMIRAKHSQATYHFVACLVFLRIDIYEKLNFPERDKLRSDELHIHWDSHDLISLIEARATASTQGKIGRRELWETIFPRRVGDLDTKKFLASRTLNRPRDIIQLCNACRDMARAKGRDRINNWDILAAAAQYSRWKLVDIQNEWNVNFPFLADALLLLSNDSYIFTQARFNEKVNLVERDFKVRYPAVADRMTCDFLLSVLFDIGVIGVIREEETYYSCQLKNEEHLRVDDERFVIHPCFREALQSTSALELRRFEESPVAVEARRSRITRGRLSGWEEGQSAFLRFSSAVSKSLSVITSELNSANIASEIKEEILLSLAGIDGQLKQVLADGDSREAMELVIKIARFFRDLRKKMIERDLLAERSDFSYFLERIVLLCDGYAEGGFTRGPFHAA